MPLILGDGRAKDVNVHPTHKPEAARLPKTAAAAAAAAAAMAAAAAAAPAACRGQGAEGGVKVIPVGSMVCAGVLLLVLDAFLGRPVYA
jgi:pyruvate/2-oxoglutarate dehydrogenase complex dihydrolipoamide acyltransferase (E2) component